MRSELLLQLRDWAARAPEGKRISLTREQVRLLLAEADEDRSYAELVDPGISRAADAFRRANVEGLSA